MKRGIAIAGNMIVDMLYPTNGLPRPGELVTITGEMTRSTGGCLCNDIIDLATLDPALPLTALGRVGDDEAADYVLDKLRACPNIDLGQVKRGGTTSYTLVMDDEVRKQRSFFQCRGANADFRESDIDWDALDAPDDVYGTKMARLLHTAKQRGIKTSIDVVSEAGERFRHIVVPALKYTDYCIINELEAQATTGIELTDASGKLHRENLPAALKKMKALGVSTWAVIHSPEGGFGLDEAGNYVAIDSLALPEGYIKGTVGAGDAFCSGVLYGAWRGMDLAEAIELGTAAAACSLSQPGGTEGMRDWESAMALYRTLRQGG